MLEPNPLKSRILVRRLAAGLDFDDLDLDLDFDLGIE